MLETNGGQQALLVVADIAEVFTTTCRFISLTINSPYVFLSGARFTVDHATEKSWFESQAFLPEKKQHRSHTSYPYISPPLPYSSR